MHCYKVFRRIDGKLYSLYNIHPLEYKENEWTHAPKGTKLFVYKLKESINEYHVGNEIWLCECDIVEESYCDCFKHHTFGFDTTYGLETCVNEKRLVEIWHRYSTSSSLKHVTVSVKPIKNVTQNLYTIDNMWVVNNET